MAERRIISFHFKLRGPSGELLDSSLNGPLSFLEGSSGILAALEKILSKMEVNQKGKFLIPSKWAYGPHDSDLVFKIDRKSLSVDQMELELGGEFETGLFGEGLKLRVSNITDKEVTLDANHPLAGMDLHYELEIVNIRLPTLPEIEHGHVIEAKT